MLVARPCPTPCDSATSRCPRTTARSPFRLGSVPALLLDLPRKYPDFAWAWLTRFLVNTGNYIGTMYLLYYVTDGLGFSEDAGPDKVFVLTVLYAGTMVVTTAFGGALERPARPAEGRS